MNYPSTLRVSQSRIFQIAVALCVAGLGVAPSARAATSVLVDASSPKISFSTVGFTSMIFDGLGSVPANAMRTLDASDRDLTFSGEYVGNCFCGNLYSAPTIYFTRNGIDLASYSFGFQQANFQYVTGFGTYREATSSNPIGAHVQNAIVVEAVGDYVVAAPERYGFATTIRFGGAALPTSAAPEPATWSFMLSGFGSLGLMLRRQRRRLTTS